MSQEQITLQEFEKKIESLSGNERKNYVIDTYRKVVGETKPGVNLLGTMYNEIVQKLKQN